jgi:hypothetical protein
MDREIRFKEEVVAFANEKRCRIGILWSDSDVDSFTRSKRKLVAAARRAEDHLADLLSEAERRN